MPVGTPLVPCAMPDACLRVAAGLEGVVGPPSPKLREGMAADHTAGPATESTDAFTTGNYGVTTSSRAECIAAAARIPALPSARRRPSSVRVPGGRGLCHR